MSIEESPAELDDDFRVRSADGRVLCALGLTATLYIERGDSDEVREGMVRAYERSIQIVGREYAWGANPDTGEPESVVQTSVGKVRGWPGQLFQRFDFQMIFHGATDIGDADPFSFVAVSREREEDQLSYLSASIPLDWAVNHTTDEYLAWVHEMCKFVGPSHGYAGLAIIAHPAGVDDDAISAVYRLGKRFRGLEIDFPPHHEAFLSTQRLIKGVNWLTVIALNWQDKLGDFGQLQNALSPLVSCQAYSCDSTATQGIVIRAGKRPLLGDLLKNEPMDAYERVARVLKPIRSIDPAIIWPQGTSGFDFDESLAWMKRFDAQ